ncbi:uncharacterized protein LOC110461930 [Mizuhopecten yessoensis]|uniref:uncharacterized protein LOC110461930 n=1 Tax=Mizuhopecten yessoensis TaxID=6573 RepID=UPI000B45D4E2|nr:uncharacterized protein LOC110461930 [Mizuhopecten yessoensis]
MNKVLVKQTYLCRRQIYSILQRNYLFSNNVINLSTSSSCVLDKRKTVSPKTRCGIDIGRYGWLPCQHLVANIHTTTNSMAGHNRWSNIKHIKGRSDDKRATLWAYHLRTIKGVLQQKKELDPKFNPELAKCLDAAKRAGVPTDVLNRAMVKLRRADLKPYLLLAENAEGVGVLLHCMITEEHELKLLHSPLRKKGFVFHQSFSVSSRYFLKNER